MWSQEQEIKRKGTKKRWSKRERERERESEAGKQERAVATTPAGISNEWDTDKKKNERMLKNAASAAEDETNKSRRLLPLRTRYKTER